ncbi:MAG: efflux RND transporter permease subunit, partial [Singulisphaera sp.]
MPADVGSDDWTVRAHDGRLEVRDRDYGLWESRPLSEVRSLTIVGADGRPNRVTLDLTEGPLSLPGGFTYRGSATAEDTLGARLDGRANAVSIEGAALTILVVFIFLNSWRSTVITGLALPVSVSASFLAVAAFGFTL